MLFANITPINRKEQEVIFAYDCLNLAVTIIKKQFFKVID